MDLLLLGKVASSTYELTRASQTCYKMDFTIPVLNLGYILTTKTDTAFKGFPF